MINFRGATRSYFVAFLVLASVSSADAQFELEAMSAGDIDATNIVVDTFLIGEPNGLRWQDTITRVGADYLRLHISEIQNPQNEAFSLIVKDGGGLEVLEYTQDTIPSLDFWTPVVFSGRVLLQLRSPAPLQSFSLRISEVAFQSDGGGWLSLIGTDDREPIVTYEGEAAIWQASQAVAKLSFFKGGFYVCTGFMVGANKMLTNHHCIADADVCVSTVAIFGYYADENGVVRPGEQVRCTSVLKSNYNMDYALLELQGSPGERWGTLELDASDVADDAILFIIQHPAGEPKQISKINCNADGAIVDGRAPNTDLAHVCDTLGGSSGSPVFSENGSVVALHHFGVGQAAFWDKNRAVRMKLIMAEIEELL